MYINRAAPEIYIAVDAEKNTAAMMKAKLNLEVFVLAALLHISMSACPHDADGLTRWSTIHKTLKPNQNVSINSHVLLDTDISLFGIHIKSGGKLVVDPGVQTINTYYIIVEGELHIGSEDCPFPGELTVMFMGKVDDKYTVQGLTCLKCINVKAGGVLELHGEFKRPWTKLAGSVNKISDSHVIYSKIEDKKAQKEQKNTGLLVRTFDSTTGSLTNSAALSFGTKAQMIEKGIQQFRDIVNVENDDCVILAFRKAILKKGDTNKEDIVGLYDEIEKLGYGSVTNDLCLRQHTFYDAFVMVACKGDKSLTRVSCGDYKLGNRWQTVEECVILKDKKFCGTSVSSSRNHGNSFAVFEVTDIAGSLPKITLAQEPTNWVEGDEICITSTDYDWNQVECGKIVKCSDCDSTQVRVNLTPRFNHYGYITDNVDMRAEVFTNTRNVRFTSKMEKFGAENGGMVKYDKGFSRGYIENIELTKFGDSTEIGIYPIHYHMCGDVKDRTYARNNAVHDSWSRCVVVHGTQNAIVDRNTCYVCKGHAFFTEDGGENNTVITNNLALGTLPAEVSIFTQLDKFPSSFFISNPIVTFTGNIAAGGEATGLSIIFPIKPTGLSADLGFLEENQAKRIPMKIEDFVAHSYKVGIKCTHHLTNKNEQSMFNQYQPKDSSGNPTETVFRKITAFKSMEQHIKIEGGLIVLDQSSCSHQNKMEALLSSRGSHRHTEVNDKFGVNTWTTKEAGDTGTYTDPDGEEDLLRYKFSSYINIWFLNVDRPKAIGLLLSNFLQSSSRRIHTPCFRISKSRFADAPIAVEFKRAFAENMGNLNLFATKAGSETPGQKPRLTNSVIVGDSDNKGTPAEGEERSYPNEEDKSVPRCGIMDTSSVWSVDNVWFGGFANDLSYDTGAICVKAKETFAVSPRNTFRNVEFGFSDPDEGKRVLNIASQNPSENTVSIFHDEQGKVTAHPGAYVLQKSEFHSSDKSETDTFWDLEISEEDFAQVRVNAKVNEVTMMRSNQIKETLPGLKSAAFNVITGQNNHYIVKFSKYSKRFTIGGIGITKDKTVVLGVCIPRDSSPTIDLFLPSKVNLEEASKWEDVFTDEYDYFWDQKVGVLLFKMKHIYNFADDDIDECPKGICPNVKISPRGKDKDDLDCFSRYRKTYLESAQRRQLKKKRDENAGHKHNLPGSDLNEDWGAKEFPLPE